METVISGSRQKIGILGGTFDPVHNGHIAAAELAVTALELDQLRLVPCYLPNPVYKNTVTASSSQRLQMLQLASRANPKLIVDELELQRGQTSFTVDTLKQLRSQRPQADLVFVLGVDSFNSLPIWHRWQEMLELTHFLVLSRPGFQIDPKVESACQLDQRRVNTAAALFAESHGKVLVLDSLAMDISSSSLRGKISQGESLAGLVDDEVLAYIQTQGLYRATNSQ